MEYEDKSPAGQLKITNCFMDETLTYFLTMTPFDASWKQAFCEGM